MPYSVQSISPHATEKPVGAAGRGSAPPGWPEGRRPVSRRLSSLSLFSTPKIHNIFSATFKNRLKLQKRMARLRKGVCYRFLERPYTRISRYKRQSFIKTGYNSKIIRFVMGDLRKLDWDLKLELCTKIDLQLRDNSVESARLTSNKMLETRLGKEGYFFRVLKYPYHILRMNPIASGAGADRFSTGMQLAFGRPVGQAAQFKKGEAIFELRIAKKDLETGKKAMARAYQKIACPCQIIVTDLKAKDHGPAAVAA